MSDFTFNASALGMGGVIDHANGTRTVISSLASVALAPTGGEAFAMEENYSQNGISFARAESRIAGYETSLNQYTTYTDIFVTDLNVFGRLKVALMQVTMTSTRHIDAEDSLFDLRAIYRGVEVDDVEHIPLIDFELCNAATYADFARTLEGKPSHYAAQLNVKEEDLSPGLVTRHDSILGAIVCGVKRNDKDKSLACENSRLTVPGLGTVRFGEFLVKPGRRRINLLRFEFGAGGNQKEVPDSGSLTVGSGDGNGVPVWPHG